MNKDLIQIQIAGGQGSGKTTLSNYIKDNFNIPYIGFQTRPHMPPNVRSHLDVLKLSVLDPDKAISFQSKLIEGRSKLFEEHKESPYVSDRSVFDSFAYYVLHNSMFDTKLHCDYLYRVSEDSLKNSNITVLLTPKVNKIDDDRVRIDNYYYQQAYNNTLSNLICGAFYKFYYSAKAYDIDKNASIIVSKDRDNLVRGIQFIEYNELLPTEIRFKWIKEIIEDNLKIEDNYVFS